MFRITGKALSVACATALTVGLAGASAPAFAATGPAPAITIDAPSEAVGPISFSPGSGGVTAATIVTLEGEGIENASEVRFGVRPATILPDAPEGQLRVQLPTAVEVKYQAKWVPVTVTIDGFSYRIGEYAYLVESGIDRQLSYTLAHWDREHYNDKQYGDFSPGDGMNFVSQTLAARGLPMDEEWHNYFGPGDSKENWSEWTTPAWISVSNFERYLERKQEQLGTEKFDLWTVDRSKLALGDIVVFEWAARTQLAERPADMPDDLWQLLAEDGDHAMVITDLVHNADGTISVKLAGHTNDRDFLDLDYVLDNIEIADGNFWHFPEC